MFDNKFSKRSKVVLESFTLVHNSLEPRVNETDTYRKHMRESGDSVIAGTVRSQSVKLLCLANKQVPCRGIAS